MKKTRVFSSAAWQMGRGVLVTGVYLFLFSLALPVNSIQNPLSTVIDDRDGMLLGARIAEDGQWRFPPGIKGADRIATAVIAYEDALFYWHPGVNPVSLWRALKVNVKAGKVRQGGSTLPMQVIRLNRRGRQRRLSEKVIEACAALRLTFQHSKEKVLYQFLDNAPFGGNVVGVEAACWRYFGKPSHLLSWAEASALAVLPNSPGLIHPGKNRDALLRKRNGLLKKLYQSGFLSDLDWETARMEPLPSAPQPLPRLAPELLTTFGKNKEGRIATTIDGFFQGQVRSVMERHHERLKGNGIKHMAVIVVSNADGAVRAYQGNAPVAYAHPGGEVDIIQALRSPGSTLKPLLYAWALQDGLLWPGSLLQDIPTQYGSYRPENFFRTYRGLVPAMEAIASSLNVPMVRLLHLYGVDRFLHRLHQHGFASLHHPADHYGLSLILGGGEISLWELTNAYAQLARILTGYNATQGKYQSTDLDHISVLHDPFAVSRMNTSRKDATHLKAGPIWSMMEAMSMPDRPEEATNWEFFSSSRKVAWKTGTSFGFKDAWSIAVMPEYTVGVWVGNADGEPKAELTGIKAAAPLLFDLLELLPATTWFEPPYNDLEQVHCCARSGMPPNPHCPLDSLLVPFSRSLPEACSFHNQVFLHPESRLRISSDCFSPAEALKETFFILPPVESYYYTPFNPVETAVPSMHPGCSNQEDDHPIQLIFPTPQTRLAMAKDLNGHLQPLVFQAVHRDINQPLHWHLDGSYLGTTKGNHQWTLAPEPGKHSLTLSDKEGKTFTRFFEVWE